jgi:hypothetical protein
MCPLYDGLYIGTRGQRCHSTYSTLRLSAPRAINAYRRTALQEKKSLQRRSLTGSLYKRTAARPLLLAEVRSIRYAPALAPPRSHHCCPLLPVAPPEREEERAAAASTSVRWRAGLPRARAPARPEREKGSRSRGRRGRRGLDSMPPHLDSTPPHLGPREEHRPPPAVEEPAVELCPPSSSSRGLGPPRLHPPWSREKLYVWCW